jgi:tRNA threonylcarbamoyladenosine biosynthesis protein TsaB
MRVLGIETSGNIGGIAVCENKHIVITKDFGALMQHGKELIPTIADVLNQLGWKPKDIDLIAVDVGPGSYTGLRVGVTCAKALAYALNKPVVDVPIFDVIAENYTMDSTPICPIIDARRDHVYACIYKLEGIQRKKLSDFLVIQPSKLLSILPRPVTIFGDGVSSYKDIFQQKDIFIDREEKALPKAEYVALLGEKIYESGHQCEINKLLPLYLRRVEAIEELDGKK